MDLYPLCINFKEKKTLFVGGGRVAADKLCRLVGTVTDLTVIAPELDSRIVELVENGVVCWIKRSFEPGDCAAFPFVIAAVGDLSVQKKVLADCRLHKNFCCAVDLPDESDFIFPAVLRREELLVAISSSGISPSLSRYLKRAIDRLLPEDLETFLTEMKALRASLPAGQDRQAKFDRCAREAVEAWFLTSNEQ